MKHVFLLLILLSFAPLAIAEVDVITFEKMKLAFQQHGALAAHCQSCGLGSGQLKISILKGAQKQGADEFQLSLLSLTYDSTFNGALYSSNRLECSKAQIARLKILYNNAMTVSSIIGFASPFSDAAIAYAEGKIPPNEVPPRKYDEVPTRKDEPAIDTSLFGVPGYDYLELNLSREIKIYSKSLNRGRMEDFRTFQELGQSLGYVDAPIELDEKGLIEYVKAQGWQMIHDSSAGPTSSIYWRRKTQ